MKNIKTLPRLTSERLIVRPIELNDVDDMYSYACKNNVGPNAGWTPHKTKEETKIIISKMVSGALTEENIGVFSIVDKKNNKMIGTVGVHKFDRQNQRAEIGYVLNPDYWGKGITAEAVMVILPWLFNEYGLYRIECRHYAHNHQSKRVIEKCGFIFEGISRKERILHDGSRTDMYNYSLLKTDYTGKY